MIFCIACLRLLCRLVRNSDLLCFVVCVSVKVGMFLLWWCGVVGKKFPVSEGAAEVCLCVGIPWKVRGGYFGVCSLLGECFVCGCALLGRRCVVCAGCGAEESVRMKQSGTEAESGLGDAPAAGAARCSAGPIGRYRSWPSLGCYY